MIDAARASSVLLMEGFTFRFTPAARFLRETLDTGRIGDLKIVKAELLGGTISVDREVDRGTTFTVEIGDCPDKA